MIQAHWAGFMSTALRYLFEHLRFLEKDEQLRGLCSDHQDMMSRTGHDHRYAYTD